MMHAEQHSKCSFLNIFFSYGAYVAASTVLFHNLIHLKEQKIHKLFFLHSSCRVLRVNMEAHFKYC